MFRNTRYDNQDYAALGLGVGHTTATPITASGERLMRGSERWYMIGHHATTQTYSGALVSQDAATATAILDKMQASGVNCIGFFDFESYGLGQSGTYTDRPVGCFKIGKAWRANLTFSNVGDLCNTQDGSRIRRTYICTTAGQTASSGSGPTSEGTGITDGTCVWSYLEKSYTTYNEQFFTGDGTAVGMDWVLDQCARRGIYVTFRFTAWGNVFTGRTGYPQSNTGNQSAYQGAWAFTSAESTAYGIADYRQFMKDHMAQFLDRVNSVNGKRYGDDPTIFSFNPWNEAGLAYHYINTTSTSSPSGNTFDYMCFKGSSSVGVAEPNAGLVSAWDQKWAAWWAATYPAVNGGVPSFKGYATLPCYAYTTLDGTGPTNNIAQRAAFRPRVGAANSTEPQYSERYKVMQFLAETELAMVLDIKAWLRTKSNHILLNPGQDGWLFPQSQAAGDLQDLHYYDNSTSPATSGNTGTGSGTLSWGAAAGGTITIAGYGTNPPIGQYVRVTQTGSPYSTAPGVVQVATSVSSGGGTWTAIGVADPGWTGAASVITPNVDYNGCALHAEPAATGAAGSTRIHAWAAGSSAESNIDVQSWIGTVSYGSMPDIGGSASHAGIPKFCSELGEKGMVGPTRGSSRVLYTLFDLLQGGNGAIHMAWINGAAQNGNVEHSIPGNGMSFLVAQLISLMSRYIEPMPNSDTTYVQPSDVYDWYTNKNTLTTYSGIPFNWKTAVDLSSNSLFGKSNQYTAFMDRRTRHQIGDTTNKSAVVYPTGGAGATFGGLTNADTGRLYFNRNVGYVTFENSKIALIAGRIPPATSNWGTADYTDLKRLALSAIDGKYWYGIVAVVSQDGSDLGVGRSALYTWMYPREEIQRFRRYEIEAGGTVIGPDGATNGSSRISRVEMLDGDYAGASDAAIQPGVVMRNDLEVQLTSPRALTATRYVNGQSGTYYAGYAGGKVYLQPRDPLIVLS